MYPTEQGLGKKIPRIRQDNAETRVGIKELMTCKDHIEDPILNSERRKKLIYKYVSIHHLQGYCTPIIPSNVNARLERRTMIISPGYRYKEGNLNCHCTKGTKTLSSVA